MDFLFVLADQHAPDRAAATAALIAEAPLQWHHTVRPALLPNPVPLWYKETDEMLTPCTASDPAAHSRWWVFVDVPPDALAIEDPH